MNQICDCGAVATLEDTSGPHCQDCAGYVARVRKAIDNNIAAVRREALETGEATMLPPAKKLGRPLTWTPEPGMTAYEKRRHVGKRWAAANRAKRLAYLRIYNAKVTARRQEERIKLREAA